MKKWTLFALPLVLLLAACHPDTNVSGDGVRLSRNGDGYLTVQAKGAPDARIGANGDLSIGGKPVTLTPAQRQLTTTYYRELDGITQAGIEIGKQGGKLAGKAVGEAISGVMSGNTDDIGSKIEAEAAKVEASARQICTHLNSLRLAQDALAAGLPEFKPYASIDAGDVEDCGKENKS